LWSRGRPIRSSPTRLSPALASLSIPCCPPDGRIIVLKLLRAAWVLTTTTNERLLSAETGLLPDNVNPRLAGDTRHLYLSSPPLPDGCSFVVVLRALLMAVTASSASIPARWSLLRSSGVVWRGVARDGSAREKRNPAVERGFLPGFYTVSLGQIPVPLLSEPFCRRHH
jgi:hypothetical protein